MKRTPDPKLHMLCSFIKSLVRGAAGVALINRMFVTSGLLFCIAEVVGVIEELV